MVAVTSHVQLLAIAALGAILTILGNRWSGNLVVGLDLGWSRLNKRVPRRVNLRRLYFTYLGTILHVPGKLNHISPLKVFIPKKGIPALLITLRCEGCIEEMCEMI